MAEGRAATQDSTCSVCLGSFQEPKVLPCCHSFCLKCLEGVLETAESRTEISCPQCKTKHQVPLTGPKGFLNDYTLNKIVCEKQLKISPDDLICDHCENRSEDVFYCTTCNEYFCEECLKAHNKLKTLRSHETKNVKSEELLTVQRQLTKTHNSTLHPERKPEIYCKTCQSFVSLLDSVDQFHADHDTKSIDSKTRKEVEKLIEDLVKETDSKLTEFEQSLQYISAVEKDKSEQSAPLKAEIDEKVDSMIAQLEARRAELHKEVDDAITKDQKELWAQKEYHETNLASLQGALSFARRSLNCQEDTELLALCATRLKELSQLKWESRSTENIEIRRLRLKETEPACLCRQSEHAKLVGELSTNACIPRVQLLLDELHSVEYQQGYSVSFQITALVKFNGNEVKKNANLTGSVKFSNTLTIFYPQPYSPYPEDQSSIHVEAQRDSNSWRVTFTPPETGGYRITFIAQGKYGDQKLYNRCSCNVHVGFTKVHFIQDKLPQDEPCDDYAKQYEPRFPSFKRTPFK